MKLINDLKEEKVIFSKYRKKYKLFGGFIYIFASLFIIKLILNTYFNYSNEVLEMFYNVLLGLSMSALFYYWIEYKKEYINIVKNKKKVLKMLEEIETMLEEVYYGKRNYKVKWDYYIDIFNHLEYLIEITYKFNWFETSYVESLMWIQIQDHYTYLKRKRHNILEKEQEGRKLYIKKGRDFGKKLSQAIKFKEIKKDVRNNKSLKDEFCFSDEMKKKIEKVTGEEEQIGGACNWYYDYCEKEVLIIQFLLVIIDDIRKIISKLKV